jgi:saccharopine dehydrogenase-like NADP-dependent oxidoreductase
VGRGLDFILVCDWFFFTNPYLFSAKDAGITVMNEIGLDPGIDHLYAVKTIEEVHAEGGKVR